MYAAKHGDEWLLLPLRRSAPELFGKRNEGSGGGGIERIASGGCELTQSKHEVWSWNKGKFS
jgi:hypothetical protein